MVEQGKYLDVEAAYQQAKTKELTQQKLAMGFNVADVYLNHTYLANFSAAPVVAASRSDEDTTKMRIVEISKIVFDKSEKFTDKLMSIYSALYNINSAAALIIRSDGEFIRFFMGVRVDQNTSLAGDLLESTLKGNFPGIEFSSLDIAKTESLISDVKRNEAKSLASVSVVPSARDEKDDKGIDSYVQGIEKFIDTMNGQKYTAVLLATPLDPASIQMRRHGYEELYSAMSPYQKVTASYAETESEAVSESLSSSFSQSVNRSVSNSNSNSSSSSYGTNSGYNSGSGSSSNFDGFGFSSNSGYSSGSFSSYTSSNSFTQSVSDSRGTTDTDGVTKGNTTTTGSTKTISLTFDNKGVANLMERAQAQLERFRICESYGMWEFSGYFMSDDIHTTALAGNSYKALMTGEKSNVESAHMNIWSVNQKDKINSILDYILHFRHPKANLPALSGDYASQAVTPTNMVSGHELPLVMGLPKKSVQGLAVVEMAEFGRSVVYENKKPARSIDFGSIYHMGVVEKTRVKMDLDLLASHCFITGSSGSGKSYATYQLLNAAYEQGVKILIVEPAKGEYKQIFGGMKGIKIYTTDPNSYRLIRVNPFQFPENVHLLSHIERLLQIFNASWPLYAAMPAILKESVVEAYVKCGWDVQNSIWIEGINDHKYPVFADILEILPRIINTSDYSADSKGDYKGALVTRVQSMTTGINGLIFKSSEGIEDSKLFDSNAVIDLSELGSDEAMALIMGVIIMKLNEYRRSKRKTGGGNISLNASLQHLTVLEEAHNILKRTSKEQDQEGANMVGQSVEMISNSIKEMRTYGEGFVIIDQSPMAVDESAIENTSTKIIMNTPAKDACEELGSALSLNEEQTRELSRLNVGVAAVFQKGWLSPVLMKVDVWDNRFETDVVATNQDSLRVVRGKIVQALLDQYHEGRFSPRKLRAIVHDGDLTTDKMRELDEMLLSYNDTLFEAKKFRRRYFSRLLLDVTGAEYLFSVIPTDAIPTFEEFRELDSSADDFVQKMEGYQEQLAVWFGKLQKAMRYYIVTDSEDVLTECLLNMLYEAGREGRIENSQGSKLPLICRMLYKLAGLPL